MSARFTKIGCIVDFASKTASAAYHEIMQRYNFIDANSFDPECDLIIAIGGDGLMLKVLHRYIYNCIPIYGMNRGSIGFLLNQYDPDGLMERLENAVQFELHPLEMVVKDYEGRSYNALAVNEVSLLRQTNQAAKLRIAINEEERIQSLVCDGVLVSTPAGSTAYNFAANGPIIPLGSNILAMTPISPFRPRRWRGALLSHESKIRIDVVDPDKRPVSAVADFHEVRDVVSVDICERRDLTLQLLFDPENSIQERMVKEQFLT